VGYDRDDEKRPRAGHDELMDRPVSVVEKIAENVWNLIVPDFIYRTCSFQGNPPSEDRRPNKYPTMTL
jgi:hypothetical protein